MEKAQVTSPKEHYEETIKNRKELISLAERELDLRAKILEVQLKHPRVLRPNLEFEDTDEYTELKKIEYQLSYDNMERQLKGVIKENQDKVVEYEKIINEL